MLKILKIVFCVFIFFTFVVYFFTLKYITMIPAERRELILNTLNENGVLHTQDIIERCDVSDITIRRDLAELEAKGLLIRTHGGAIKSQAIDKLFTYAEKMNQNRQNKEAICQLAATYISEGDIVFVDCGTTLSLLPKFLVSFKSLTVITTSLPVIYELFNNPNIRLSLIGGEIDVERQATYGSIAEDTIGNYHANKAFIGADGLSLKKGLSSYDEKEGSISRKMIENSDEAFLLCDSSKIEKNSFVKFASINNIHHLITDKELTKEHSKMYKDFVNVLN